MIRNDDRSAGRADKDAEGAFHALRPLVLASASPRRRELLARLGPAFDVLPADGAAEPRPGMEDPAAYAMRAAEAKALAVAERLRRDRLRNGAEATAPVVIGADTVVVLPDAGGPVILGKPASDEEALAMLLRLAGREHTVCTGCCLIWPGGTGQEPSEEGRRRRELFCDSAGVTFAPWPEEVLAAYVRTGEGRDKAGSYAMQGLGAFLVSEIRGQWSTVVGLPIQSLALRLLREGVIAPRPAKPA